MREQTKYQNLSRALTVVEKFNLKIVNGGSKDCQYLNTSSGKRDE